MIATMGGGIGTVERSGRRIVVAYLLLLGLVAVVAAVVLRAGADRRPAPAIGGVYRLDQAAPRQGAAWVLPGSIWSWSSRGSSSASTARAAPVASCGSATGGWRAR